MDSIINWQFLNEPLKKWFIFIVAFALMLTAWRGIIGLIKG